MSPDGLTYTFKIRSGVVFHDGTPLSSKDVKATFDRLRAPPDGIVSIRKELFADIASIDAPDPTTVVMKLKAPDASLLEHSGAPYNCIYSADRLAQDPNFPAKTVMGSGPFVFVEHVNGSHWIGKRFDKYWEKGKPYLDGFNAVFIKSTAVVTALQGGQIQAEFRSISPGERTQLVRQPQGQHHRPGSALGVQGRPALQHRGQAVRQSQGPAGPVDGHRSLGRFRRAVQDHHRQAGRRPAAARARRSRSANDQLAALPGYGRDAEKSRAEAKRLLAEAGVANLKFKLINRNVNHPFTPVGVYVIDQWRRIGVTAEHRAARRLPAEVDHRQRRVSGRARCLLRR